jgi:uncharacterized protein (DUF2147 family)
MRTFLYLALATFLLVGARAGAGDGPSITGDWSRTDGASRINIAPCGDHLCAVNTWIRDPAGGESVGDRLVLNLQPREPARLAGEAFDERRKFTYSLLISVDNDAMTTHGCMFAHMACRTINWIRMR